MLRVNSDNLYISYYHDTKCSSCIIHKEFKLFTHMTYSFKGLCWIFIYLVILQQDRGDYFEIQNLQSIKKTAIVYRITELDKSKVVGLVTLFYQVYIVWSSCQSVCVCMHVYRELLSLLTLLLSAVLYWSILYQLYHSIPVALNLLIPLLYELSFPPLPPSSSHLWIKFPPKS